MNNARRPDGEPSARRIKRARERNTTASGGSNAVRIVGGQWRGRKLRFPSVAAIRPTPDRVRETLFNWLQQHIVGASCLDLFAGSGALGFEALSRGAAEVTFVEREPDIVQYLRATLVHLHASGGRVVSTTAEMFLRRAAAAVFDIVFLDPPFADDVLPVICEQLERGNWLAADAWIYLEYTARAGLPPLPSNWQVVRSKTAGQVGYHLARRGGGRERVPDVGAGLD